MEPQEVRRVVVTGMGVATSLGVGVDESWRRLLKGECGIRRLRAIDPTPYRTQNASEVDDDAVLAALATLGQRPQERTSDLALVAAAQALDGAGLPMPADQDNSMGVMLGTGGGCANALYAAYHGFFAKGPRGIRPTAVPRTMFNAISSRLSLVFGLRGPNFMIVSACSSSATAIGIAFRTLRHGYADTILCGGAECMLEPVTYGAWDNLGVLSRISDPQTCCRPFDKGRKGFILGEAAGMLVLETLDEARRRGRAVHAEVVGYAETSDATHITRPNAAGQAAAIRGVLASAALSPDEIGFVNAHGTATEVSDVCESSAIRAALGPATDHVPVVSNKSALGHLIGASGAVEAIMSILALRDQTLPPNLNLDDPDERCDLCLVGGEAAPFNSSVALSHSFGFGGHNVALALRRTDACHA